MAVGDEFWKDISFNIPSLLPLQPPPQTQEQIIPYIQALHNYLADDRQKIARAINVVAYFRNIMSDEAQRPNMPLRGMLFTALDTGEMSYADGDAWNPVTMGSANVEPDTTNFNGILSAADDTLQKALDTIDDHGHSEYLPLTAGSSYPIIGDLYFNMLYGGGDIYVSSAGPDVKVMELSQSYVAFMSGIKTDSIDEQTTSNGVYIDGIRVLDNDIYVDTIYEKTAAHGVYIDGARIKDQGASFYAAVNAAGLNVNPSEPYVDLQSSGVGNYWRIYTPNSANGSFRISDMNAAEDCFLIEDSAGANALVVGATYLSTTKILQVDTIFEKTSSAGVTIDGVKLKDYCPYTNAIYERTGGSGVTVDGVLCKDSLIEADGITLGDGTGSVVAELDKSETGTGDLIWSKAGTEQWRLRCAADETFILADVVNAKNRVQLTADGDIDLMLPATSGYVKICSQWGAAVSKFSDSWCNLKINTAAPADADMEAKTITFYNSGNTIYVKFKDWSGTTRTGTVCTTS